MHRFLLLPFLSLLLMLLAAFAPAHAQSSGRAIAEQRAAIAEVEARTKALEEVLERGVDEDKRLVEIRSELSDMSQKLITSGASFQPRLSEINTRIDQLGAAPAEGQPAEPTIVADERRNLTDEKAEINATIGIAEDLSIRINGGMERTTEMRRELFTGALSRRYDIALGLNSEVWSEFSRELEQAERAFESWLSFAFNFKFSAVLLATLFSLMAAAVLRLGGQRLFDGMLFADPAREDPTYLSRLSVAFWSTLVPSVALAVFFLLTWYLYDAFGVMRDDIGELLFTIFTVIVVFFFTVQLARAVLSPDLPNWRLLAIRTSAARLLFWLVVATSAVICLDSVLTRFNEVLRSPLSLTIAKSLITTVLVGLLVILIGLVRPYRAEDGSPKRWPRPLRYLLFLLGGATVAAAILGYIGLARFVSQQMVVTGAILATMYIGYRSAAAVSEDGAFARTAFAQRLNRRFNFDASTNDQLGLVAGIVLNILVLLIGIPLILLQWGFQWADLRSMAYTILTDVRIGSVTISVVGILLGIAIFLVVYFGTRGFQRWLDGRVMTRGKVDAGVRNSIRTAVGYLGIAVAALFGLSVAGIDFSNIALVAGALSLGIGFGLQNIVNNFVSGLILLAERPFKAGDWIVAGAVTGTVRKISVRATEIETFQRQTIILPNSELINAAVGNWTHKNKLGRVDVKVAVAYGSDLRHVHAVLLEIARDHPLVLRNPEPFVAFTNILDFALEFEVRVFLADILEQGTVANDIRFAIVERFEEEQIGIPYAQRANTVTLAEHPTDPAPHAPIVGEGLKPDEDVQAMEAGKEMPVEAELEADGTAKPRRKRRKRGEAE